MANRLYSLFDKVQQGGRTRWVRVPNAGAYRKKTAVVLFQDKLLEHYRGDGSAPVRELRVVPGVVKDLREEE